MRKRNERLFDWLWRDDDCEASAEEFVMQATSAEDVGEDARNEFVEEELGGPFSEFAIIVPEEEEELPT